LQDLGYRFDQQTPGFGFLAELAAAQRGELIELGPAVIVREPPLGLDPFAGLEAVQRWVQRPFADLEDVAGELLDPAGDGIAMRRPPAQRLEDQEIEGSLNEINRLWQSGLPSKDEV